MLDVLIAQIKLVGAAPWPFFIVWSILTYGAYRLARHHFGERLANMETRISLRDEQISLLKERLQSDTAPAPALGQPKASVPPSVLVSSKPLTRLIRTDSGEKELLDPSITPQSLMLLCKDTTTVQAKRITAEYIGKWISIEGKLENVIEGVGGRHSVMLEIPRDRFSSTIYLGFGRPEPVLESLPVGAPVKAIGRIELIRELSMELIEAELI